MAAPSTAGSMSSTRRVPEVTGDTAPIIRIVELFPAPFGPEEPERLPLANLEVDGVDGDEVVETLGELAGFHQGAHDEHTTGGPVGRKPTKGPWNGVLRSPRWARSTVSR